MYKHIYHPNLTKKIYIHRWYKEKQCRLLHRDESKAVPFWQSPFHFVGTGSIFSSLKLSESGHIPASRITINTDI